MHLLGWFLLGALASASGILYLTYAFPGQIKKTIDWIEDLKNHKG